MVYSNLTVIVSPRYTGKSAVAKKLWESVPGSRLVVPLRVMNPFACHLHNPETFRGLNSNRLLVVDELFNFKDLAVVEQLLSQRFPMIVFGSKEACTKHLLGYAGKAIVNHDGHLEGKLVDLFGDQWRECIVPTGAAGSSFYSV